MKAEPIPDCQQVHVADDMNCENCGKYIQRHGMCYRIATHDNGKNYDFKFVCVSCKELGEMK